MATLTVSEQQLLPSPDDVDFYDEHGWFQTPIVFDEAEVDAAVEAVRLHQEGIRDAAPPTEVDEIDDWSRGSAYPIRINDYVAQTNQALRSFTGRPVLAAIAARLARTNQIRLWKSSIVYKEPKVTGEYGVIGWHTDNAYWRCCSSTDMLTAWIALQDCDESMGALTMIDGSHRWPPTPDVLEMRRGRTFMGNDPAELRSRLDDTGMPIQFVPMNLRKGQVSFHNCLTLHGSLPNLSDRPRIGAIVHMQDFENHYQRVEENGTVHSHGNNEACRRQSNGDPDYTDPRICPVLWDDVA